MREELEQYLEMLRADLEVEVDLHGSRTVRARDLRNLITYTEQELSSLKTEHCDKCGEETENGAGHYLEELGTEDRLCTGCAKCHSVRG